MGRPMRKITILPALNAAFLRGGRAIVGEAISVHQQNCPQMPRRRQQRAGDSVPRRLRFKTRESSMRIYAAVRQAGLYLVLGFLAFGGCAARPHPAIPQASPTEEVRVEEAIRNGDHAALARYYRDMAQRERETAKIHEKAGTSYRGSVHYRRVRKRMTSHCHRLKWEALDRAKLYERLAGEEETLVNHP